MFGTDVRNRNPFFPLKQVHYWAIIICPVLGWFLGVTSNKGFWLYQNRNPLLPLVHPFFLFLELPWGATDMLDPPEDAEFYGEAHCGVKTPPWGPLMVKNPKRLISGPSLFSPYFLLWSPLKALWRSSFKKEIPFWEPRERQWVLVWGVV